MEIWQKFGSPKSECRVVLRMRNRSLSAATPERKQMWEFHSQREAFVRYFCVAWGSRFMMGNDVYLLCCLNAE